MSGPGRRSAVEHQVVEAEHGDRRIVSMPSAYDVAARNRERDVVVNASYVGVWPARFMAEQRPRAIVGVDCGIGLDGAGIAGLWYLEALGIPAVAAAVLGVELLNGADVLRRGVVSRCNGPAEDCGVTEGMAIAAAADALLRRDPVARTAAERSARTVVAEHPSGRAVVCTSSIAFALPEDRGRNVLCTGGFAGAPNIERAAPFGFICSDGGRGRDDSGLRGLAAGIPGAVVDVQTARMGDGLSTWRDGITSAANAGALACGVRVGQSAREAAWRLACGPDLD